MDVSRNEIYRFFVALEGTQPIPEPVRRERERYFKSAIGRIHELLRLVAECPESRILEIGSSPFFASHALVHFLKLDPSRFVMVDGSGPCDAGVARGEKSLFSCPYDRFCLNAEITPLPFAGESFDLVICQDVIEHLLYDPMFLVQQCNRVLKKGGTLILSTAPAVFSWHVTLRHLFNLTVEMGFDLAGRNPYARHHRLFSLAEVRRMVADNGFAVRRAFVRSHWYKIDGGMSLRARFAKRAVYLLDLGSAALSVLLPFLREKGGSQIWVVGEKSEFLEKIVYPRTLDIRSDFSD
jgi:SAM-dependent methyltransferase